MEVVTTTDELRELLSGWRHEGDHIALVPTMGDLHDGQVSLVESAREHAERVVVSIFRLPDQPVVAEAGGDLAGILERDKRRLKLLKTDLLFLPDVCPVDQRRSRMGADRSRGRGAAHGHPPPPRAVGGRPARHPAASRGQLGPRHRAQRPLARLLDHRSASRR